MNSEFDFDDEDLGFEDELDFEEVLPTEVRTVILIKNNMIGLLCMKTSVEGGAICRVDPRESQPSVQIYDDPEKVQQWFNKSLRTSRANGWLLAYDGEPLVG
jgi:inorganic pyrophosphatase